MTGLRYVYAVCHPSARPSRPTCRGWRAIRPDCSPTAA